MPPRKKTKRAHSTTPPEDTAAQSSADTPGSTDSAEKSEPKYDLIGDPWTDEQETALLKAIIKWKPVGVHKHFRMLAIADYLKSQGYAPSSAEHMRIPGIWKKLGSLYNLEALDEREDAVFADTNEDDEEPSQMYWPFELPYDEYGDLMFERRLATESSLSPVTSRHTESRRGSTVADTDEPRSSPAPSRGRKYNRGTRQAARETRSTRLQVEIGSGSQGKASDEDAESGEDSDLNDEGDEEEAEEGSDAGKDSDDEEEEESSDKGGSRSTRAKASRPKPKDTKKASASTTTRRTGRRR
ncbi:uncharacterized protein N7473_010447 [Penicillium subrubescens]|uniref:Chromatin modification-related protein EAF7 n=1 Tax=Penicillium subrubescens TaxID=1316194 RepID=A0A1Q5SZ59_9EURO|nr:uncharacterized protein N7473_010447 [Penicillium subrubescens]KAJ5883561.1 hypothetical protein N7473_010447 [Penicillium subrubescens]OKO93311.1 Chromatin modification-related protein EAF7 [Penicillium subrubescens]